MTFIVGTPFVVLIILAGAIVALSVLLTRSARAERALRESEARFRLVADRAPVMIWTARPDTTLDYLNTTCVEFTGRTLEQLSNEGWLDSVHPEDVDLCRNTYEPAFEARQPFLMEYRVRHADGGYRWLWRRVFRSTVRMAALQALSAAMWTSPSGGAPRTGLARAEPHWSRVIERFSIWPDG
jgi:PAS domain S-box-containing protein